VDQELSNGQSFQKNYVGVNHVQQNSMISAFTSHATIGHLVIETYLQTFRLAVNSLMQGV